MNKILKSINVLESFNDEVDIMECEFENDIETYLILQNYQALHEMIGKEVIVKTRPDMYKGQIKTFISNISEVAKISVLSEESLGKLYSEDIPEIGSNIAFVDIAMEEEIANAKVYCMSATLKHSTKAEWIELNVMDKKRQQAVLRVFDPNIKTPDVAKRYIIADIKKTKYGLATKKVLIDNPATIEVNPEILLARNYIERVLENFEEIKHWVTQLGLLNKMADFSYNVEYEVGYEIVELANNLHQAVRLKDATGSLDVNSIIEAVFLDKLYILMDSPERNESREIMSYAATFLIKGFKPNPKAREIILPDVQRDFYERKVFRGIKELTKLLLNNRKGLDL